MRSDALRQFVARRWFLLALALGLALACGWPEALRWADWMEARFVVPAALFLMSLTLPTRNLLTSVARPGPALWAYFISYSLVPALAWAVGWLLPSDLRVGLLISAAVPCTLASAVIWTRRAGGDDATALVVVLLTTMTSWLVTTLWLTYGTSVALTADFGPMMLDLVTSLIVPVSLGQLGRGLAPVRYAATRFKTALSIVAQCLVLAILLKAALLIVDQYAADAGALSAPMLALISAAPLAVHLVALGFGYWTSRLWGFGRPQQIAVAFAGSQKTLPVAMLLFDRYFRTHYPLAVVPLALYHFGQLIADTFIADYWAAQTPHEPEPALPPASGID